MAVISKESWQVTVHDEAGEEPMENLCVVNCLHGHTENHGGLAGRFMEADSINDVAQGSTGYLSYTHIPFCTFFLILDSWIIISHTSVAFMKEAAMNDGS